MATSTTLRLVRSEVAVIREPQVSESRLRRLFRRKARRQALAHHGWRDEAFLRASSPWA
jgi:hypothetical protein